VKTTRAPAPRLAWRAAVPVRSGTRPIAATRRPPAALLDAARTTMGPGAAAASAAVTASTPRMIPASPAAGVVGCWRRASSLPSGSATATPLVQVLPTSIRKAVPGPVISRGAPASRS
jgi:hypothetical protein